MSIKISLSDAIARYSLSELLGQGITSLDTYAEVDATTVIVYENNEVLNASLILNEMVHEEGIAGIIALGNLRIDGSIVDFESDTLSSFVFVKGNLSVVSLVGGCAEIVVEGDVHATEVIMGYGGHGRLAIGGDVHARLVVVDNHSTEIAGTVSAATFGYGNALPHWEFSDWQEVLSEHAVVALLEGDGSWKYGNGSEFVAHLLQEHDVLKPHIGR